MRRYTLEEIGGIVESSLDLLKICSNISEEECERLGYTKEKVELIGLRIDNFIHDAEFTIKAGRF